MPFGAFKLNHCFGGTSLPSSGYNYTPRKKPAKPAIFYHVGGCKMLQGVCWLSIDWRALYPRIHSYQVFSKFEVISVHACDICNSGNNNICSLSDCRILLNEICRISPFQILGSWVWIPLETWIFVFFCVLAVRCADSRLGTGWCPLQGDLRTPHIIKRLRKRPRPKRRL
jgi:hypothetical protein